MDKHIINNQASMLQALDKLNALSGGSMTLMVVDTDGRMSGTLTDGDVRRALLRGVSLNDNVTCAANPDFMSMSAPAADPAVIKHARSKGVRLLPMLDSERRIVAIYDLAKVRSVLPLSAILMAGGKGERLRPLTLTTPKPLLEINGKAIIDYNIEALARCGITDITVATRYMADMVEAHFANPVAGVKVKCVRETQPLGTIGAASLVAPRDPDGATLVMNSDLLTSISLEDMYLYHAEQQAAVTVAAIPYVVSVPYAILSTSHQLITGIEEKPTYTHYANAGIYIIANRLLDNLEPNRRIDATDLIAEAVASGEKAVYFPINGTWIDIGTPSDFRQACDLMKHLNSMHNG